MSAPAVSASFLEGGRGRICAVMRRPAAPAGHAVLVAPPFAEEMNKTRRMLTEVALGLLPRGVATVVVDLYGTGDSGGEFREGSCAVWIEDLARAAAWSAQAGFPVAGLLAVRLGCVLGAEAARSRVPGVRRSVFWQPVIDGDSFLTQFLRLRVAASMMDGPRETVKELRQALLEGRSVEVGGYELSADLARELGALKLAELLGPHLGELEWLELLRSADSAPAATTAASLETARSRGVKATLHTLVGEPFWTSTEIVVVRDLVDATVGALAPIAEPA